MQNPTYKRGITSVNFSVQELGTGRERDRESERKIERERERENERKRKRKREKERERERISRNYSSLILMKPGRLFWRITILARKT